MHYDPNPPQSLPTEANLQPQNYNTSPQPQIRSRSYPTILIVLFIFLIIQLFLAIAMLILKIVLKYIGFDNSYPLVIDSLNCTSQTVTTKYYGKQLQILSISFVMMIICIALSIVLLIITIKSLYYSKKLSSEQYETQERSLLISSLYHIIGGKTRALMYILESICLLNIIVTLGYFLSYYINLPQDTCTWTSFNKTNILILWVIAAVLFIIAWVVWVIIVLINLKNNRDEVYKYENGTQKSTKYQEYKSQRKQSKQNNTIQNEQQQKKQPKQEKIYRVKTTDEEKKQEQPYIIRAPYNTYKPKQEEPQYKNTYTYKPQQQEPENKHNYTYKPKQQDQYKNTYTYKPKQQDQYKNTYTYKPKQQENKNTYTYKHQEEPKRNYTYKPQEQPEKRDYTYKPREELSPERRKQPYNYEPKKSPKSYVYNERPYENPIFQEKKKDIYDSPYDRIERGPYYEGDRVPFDNRQKDKQFKRSRYNNDNNEQNLPKPKQDHQYLRTLSRHRLDQQQKDYFRSNQNQNRRILPQNEYRPRSPNNFYEGANKPRLHGSYFNDQGSFNKKKADNTQQKRKRGGILSDYLRGKSEY